MCTSFTVTAEDGSVTAGRTMEFAFDLESRLLVFPRGMSYQAKSPDPAVPGYSWRGTYGSVGMNLLGRECLLDGVNETGLYFGALYLPNFTEYQTVPVGRESESMSQIHDVGNYLLSTCASVSEAAAALERVLVWGQPDPGTGKPIELHYTLHDASGSSLVAEYIDGELQLHDNPLSVLTNSPPFEWHLLNTGNYVNLSAVNVPDLPLSGYDVSALGQGSGMLGLPGDFTPPSRFVRAVALTQAAEPAPDAATSAIVAAHILDSFDIPKGFVRSGEDGPDSIEYTEWSTIAGLAADHRRYFVRYYDSPVWCAVDLSDLDFDQEDVTVLDTTATWCVDVTPSA
ncbi:linear amide C-N hydrolase [Nocardia asteroides]|uniref:Choloylglycine hydrolase n=1 Tax=Nocardia asteroides NBRC 15531 TaxID=1110697 RepID=U5E834_NOCAS|nr:choloylglycine hydrolase family protein [Nocardia asteroides]UGT48966.1 choloylglycine hydrolase family protein [Nocardia asteroides]GAD83515.1 putative choloylglycine hydrolase [Nocardia asteroides NBRC 15531]SFL76150.1 choloylglycine hydrolase [Nocardia asteroides]VEG31263.1 Penicillin V acylase and related amidases [Nocardia asteroides]